MHCSDFLLQEHDWLTAPADIPMAPWSPQQGHTCPWALWACSCELWDSSNKQVWLKGSSQVWPDLSWNAFLSLCIEVLRLSHLFWLLPHYSKCFSQCIYCTDPFLASASQKTWMNEALYPITFVLIFQMRHRVVKCLSKITAVTLAIFHVLNTLSSSWLGPFPTQFLLLRMLFPWKSFSSYGSWQRSTQLPGLPN